MKKLEGAVQPKQSTFKKERDDFKSVEPEPSGKHDFGIKGSAGDNTTKNKQNSKHDFDIMLGGQKVNAAQFVSRLRLNTVQQRRARGQGKKKGVKGLALFHQSSFGSLQQNTLISKNPMQNLLSVSGSEQQNKTLQVSDAHQAT